MARFVRRVLWFPVSTISLVLALAACGAPNAADQRDDPSNQQIRAAADALLEDLHDRGLFNGAVVLGRAGEEIYARGFGPANVEAGVPFAPDTPADGASMAKTFAAASILMLQDEGRLGLDDAVRKYVPEYPYPTTQVGHLIAHSAGLGYDAIPVDLREALWPEGEILTTTTTLNFLGEHGVTPVFDPGTRFSYCNLCYDVAALIVERITGVRWEDFLQEHVLEPLGMDSTFVRPARFADWPGVRTLSYQQNGDSLEPINGYDNWGTYGGAGMYFSTRDLYRWSRSFYTRPVLSSAVLSAGSEAPLIRDPATGEGGRSAINLLSWYYSPEGRRYQYSGFRPGFKSYVYRDEGRRYSIVYMTNNNVPTWLWSPVLVSALIDVMEGRAPAPIERPAYAGLNAENVGAIAGTYSVPSVGMVTIATRDTQAAQEPRPGVAVASLRIDSGIEYDVYPDEGLLYVPGMDVGVGFRDTVDGSFRYMDWLSVFRAAEGERVPPSPVP